MTSHPYQACFVRRRQLWPRRCCARSAACAASLCDEARSASAAAAASARPAASAAPASAAAARASAASASSAAQRASSSTIWVSACDQHAPGSAAQLCTDEHGRQQPHPLHARVAWRRPQCCHSMHMLAVLIPELLLFFPCEYPLRAESGDTRRQACSRPERQTSCAHPAAQLFLRTGGRLPLCKHLRFD